MSFRNLGLVALALTLPVAAQAQQRITWNVGGASAVTLGETRERFGNGPQMAFGVTFDPGERLGLQFEYAISGHDIKGVIFDPTFRGSSKMQQFDFNARYVVTPTERPVTVYVVGGPGFYWRDVTITRYEGTDPVCDPFLLICESDPTKNVLGSRSTWDFGVNVGAGVAFPLTDYMDMYVEARFHYLWGPEVAGVQPVTSGPTRANGHYLPVTFGLRF